MHPNIMLEVCFFHLKIEKVVCSRPEPGVKLIYFQKWISNKVTTVSETTKHWCECRGRFVI